MLSNKRWLFHLVSMAMSLVPVVLANESTVGICLVRLVLRLSVRLVARSVHPAHGCRPLVPSGLPQRASVMERPYDHPGLIRCATVGAWYEG